MAKSLYIYFCTYINLCHIVNYSQTLIQSYSNYLNPYKFCYLSVNGVKTFLDLNYLRYAK